MAKDKIFACIASIPQRQNLLIKSIHSIVNQVDEVYVYLNDYSEESAEKIRGLSKNKISYVIGDNSLGDAYKFYWSDKLRGFILTLDDDLIYPSDYVEKIIAGIEKYNRLSVVTFHGKIFKFPIADYENSYIKFTSFKQDLNEDLFVHGGGTGCMGWHSDTIELTMKDFPSPNMADTHFAILAQKKKIPICLLSHKSNWIVEMPSSISISNTRARHGYLEHKKRVIELGVWKLYGVKFMEARSDGNLFDAKKGNILACRNEKNNKRYSAIVLNWNESHVSLNTVENLLKENIDVIVVDNGSTDGSGDKLREKFGDRIKLVLLNRNCGSSIARNIGIDLVENEFTFLIDGDILYVEGTISKYRKILNDFPKCACVGYFDWDRRQSEGWAHGTKDRGKSDKKIGSVKKIGTWYPMAWTQYGLFRTEVLKKYRFISIPPFNTYGYGFEDDWLYRNFNKDGWVSYSVNTPYYFHDAHFSIREMERLNLDKMIAQRKEVFCNKWGHGTTSGEIIGKLEKKYFDYNDAERVVDVIMTSNTADKKFFDMTQAAINTLHESEDNICFNIYLIETNKKYKEIGSYSGCNVIIPDIEFHYNKFLNIGLNYCKNEYVVIANNDLIFESDWFSRLRSCMIEYGLDSASPLCPEWTKSCKVQYENPDEPIEIGFDVGKHFFGHCFVFRRNILDKLGKFDEQFSFWYQDDDFSRQLKMNGFKHGIIKKSHVTHLVNQSHKLLGNKKEVMTRGMKEVFDKKYSK